MNSPHIGQPLIHEDEKRMMIGHLVSEMLEVALGYARDSCGYRISKDLVSILSVETRLEILRIAGYSSAK